jgi:hypothetical protein
VNYHTDKMRGTAQTIQLSGTDFQAALQHFWTAYQTNLSGMGKLPTMVACLSGWMTQIQHPLDLLAQNRVDLGTKLDQAATAVEQLEERYRQIYRGGRRPI